MATELWFLAYEEQRYMKRLVLKEEVRVRRVRAWEHRLFEDTVRRERLVVEEAKARTSSASSSQTGNRQVLRSRRQLTLRPTRRWSREGSSAT